MTRDRRWLWLLLVVVVVLVASVSASRRRSGPPFDPDSTDETGARGLVVFLEASGVDVDVSDDVPDVSDADRIVVIDDRMPADQAAAVERFASSGGVVVVVDESSLLSPRTESLDGTTASGSCDDGSLADVDEIELSSHARGFDATDAAVDVACFVDDGFAFVVSERVGDGQIVSVGDPNVFTNEYLDRADNAVLAAALLGDAGSRLTVLMPAPNLVGAGDESLIDLVPTPVKVIGVQCLVVFAYTVWWKGRRLGRPVPEPQLVAIAGSELTRAVGRLLDANGRPDRAAALLRDRARTDLSPALGLTQDASRSDVAAALARATQLSETEIHIAIAAPVADDQQLLTVARLLSRIRQEVLHDTTVH